MVDHPGFGCQAGEAAVEERDGDFDEADRYVEKRRLSCSELGYMLLRNLFGMDTALTSMKRLSPS